MGTWEIDLPIFYTKNSFSNELYLSNKFTYLVAELMLLIRTTIFSFL